MKNFDLIIIGAGASGCIASIYAKNKYKKVLIIDKENKIAKKILVTGNGRCNLTNINTTSKFYNQNLDKYFNQFTINQTLTFFNKLGLEYYNDDEGRVYPISNSAKSVVEVISNKIEQLGINYELNSNVKEIKIINNNYLIETDKDIYSSTKLIIATGGNSLKNIKTNIHLKVKKFTPSLVSLKLNSSKNLANIRLSNILVKLIKDNKIIYEEKGEVLFKENGISGICIFNISSYISRSNNLNGDLVIDLLPELTHEKITNILSERRKLNLPINKFFDGFFIKQIGYEILNRSQINENRFSNEISNIEIKALTHIIKNLNFKIKSFLENNQVFSGGIPLSELSSSLEHQNYPGLYFCGEICDVDGLCGGYNLQWAWTSGAIVGKSI